MHIVISYVHNFDQSVKFQIVFEAHGSSVKLNIYILLVHVGNTKGSHV